MKRTLLACCLVWSLAVATASAADLGPTLTKTRAEARTALVTRLVEVAKWCNEREIFLERNRIWLRILELDPDNTDARRGLKHSRGPDGKWKEVPPREAKNLNTKALPELAKRERAAWNPYGATLVAALDAEKAPKEVRTHVFDEVLRIDPNNEAVHEALGDVLLGDLWVLPETKRGKERRAEIKAAVRASIDGIAEPATVPPSPEETALHAGWKGTCATAHVRCLTSLDPVEASTIARMSEAAGAVLGGLLGIEPKYPPGFTIFLLGTADRDGFLERISHLDAAERQRLSRLTGSGIPRTYHVGLWDGDAAQRLDGAVRHSLGHLVTTTLGVQPQCAWAWEGLGLYLTREVVGTRLTWFVAEASANASGEAAALRGKLLGADSNWMNEALQLLSGDAPPTLERALARNLDELETEDMLLGYVLVAYLLEGRPEQAVAFFQRIGAGEAPRVVSEEVLAMSIPELQARLQRWLTERR